MSLLDQVLLDLIAWDIGHRPTTAFRYGKAKASAVIFRVGQGVYHILLTLRSAFPATGDGDEEQNDSDDGKRANHD